MPDDEPRFIDPISEPEGSFFRSALEADVHQAKYGCRVSWVPGEGSWSCLSGEDCPQFKEPVDD